MTGILFIVIVIVIMQSNTYQHEMVHKKIYERFGINSTIHITPFYKMFYSYKAGYTEPINMTDAIEKCNDDCMNLNTLNEIIGYNNDSNIGMIGLTGFMICIVIIINSHLKNDFINNQKEVNINNEHKG